MNRSDIDNHKLVYHPKRVAEWFEKGDCSPLYVEMGITNSCNHKCIFCSLHFIERKRDFIDKNVLAYNLKNMAELGVKSVMFAGEGESLLHKDIGFFTQEAKKNGLDVSITTNGVPFTNYKREQCLPNLSWIRFSVDAGSPEVYANVHGTTQEDFRRVISNIEETVKFKHENKLETIVGVQFVAIPQNIGEACKLAKILSDIGADNLQIKPFCYRQKGSNDFVIDSEEYTKLEELEKFNSPDFKVMFRRNTLERIENGINYSKCYGLPFMALIDAKGDILPCNLFYDNEEFTYGNLYKEDFDKIWKGDKRKEVLEKIGKKGTSECRKGCRLDPLNRYLHRLENPDPHDNFI